jgi:hypothetical protein
MRYTKACARLASAKKAKNGEKSTILGAKDFSKMAET